MKALPQAMAGANFHIGIIAGKVERRDAGDDAERLAHRIEVDAGTGAFGVFALQQMRNAAGEFDHLEAALDVALGVGERLAVLGREQLGERLHLLLRQVEELEHHARAALRIGGGPGRAARPAALAMAACDLGLAGERDLGLDLAGIGIEHVAETAGCPCDRFAADEMADVAHGSPPVGSFLSRILPRYGPDQPATGPN